MKSVAKEAKKILKHWDVTFLKTWNAWKYKKKNISSHYSILVVQPEWWIICKERSSRGETWTCLDIIGCNNKKYLKPTASYLDEGLSWEFDSCWLFELRSVLQNREKRGWQAVGFHPMGWGLRAGQGGSRPMDVSSTPGRESPGENSFNSCGFCLMLIHGCIGIEFCKRAKLNFRFPRLVVVDWWIAPDCIRRSRKTRSRQKETILRGILFFESGQNLSKIKSLKWNWDVSFPCKHRGTQNSGT